MGDEGEDLILGSTALDEVYALASPAAAHSSNPLLDSERHALRCASCAPGLRESAVAGRHNRIERERDGFDSRPVNRDETTRQQMAASLLSIPSRPSSM
jgi:hypothetical protein